MENDKGRGRTEKIDRREFLAGAAVVGMSAVWATSKSKTAAKHFREAREFFPEGVASGDPDSTSVLLWTRRPYPNLVEAKLRVEVSDNETFTHVIATTAVSIASESDWTCRVLVGNLKPSRVYWYRFIDMEGNASRIGKSITAPAVDDKRPAKFAFVSCQNANLGAQSAYRRMIFEDERATAADRIGFVLHLGDFIYEVVWYPEDRPQGLYDRRAIDIVRYPQGEKINDFHIPVTVEDYRCAYRAYLHDPDIQDAQARWPFVCMWDNHEFSWYGWQSIQVFNGHNRPAQTRKVAANQAWFEYQPARLVGAGGRRLEQFAAAAVTDSPIESFDEQGLGQEPNNRAALASLTGYRVLQWGKNVDLVITDQRSYRSEDPTGRAEVKAFVTDDFPELVPQEVLEILDAGRAYNNDNPPDAIRFGSREIANFRKDSPPQTILGAEQKRWFLGALQKSRATWKIWGNTLGTLDHRVDPQNLPAGHGKPWPGSGYAAVRSGDFGTAYAERSELYRFVRKQKITGFVTLSGDRHSFWAGLAAAELPPRAFKPVGISFVVGSISAPSMLERLEHSIPATHPLRSLYLGNSAAGSKSDPTVNMLMHHGVLSCLEFARSGDSAGARKLSNPDLAPHLSFLDLGGHGFATIHASQSVIECEFVCTARPLERASSPEGSTLRYRVIHRTRLWDSGESPKLEQRVVEGDPSLEI